MYQTWVDYTNNHVDDMTTAIKAHDLTAIGELAETDALMMHATNATSVPPFNYLTDTSWTCHIVNVIIRVVNPRLIHR